MLVDEVLADDEVAVGRGAEVVAIGEKVGILRLQEEGQLVPALFAGVGGEQYAEPDAVEALRQSRDEERRESWVMLSGADPLNLVGIVTPGPRVRRISIGRSSHRTVSEFGST